MSQEPRFEPSGVVVLRTPLLPFEELEAWSGGLRSPEAGDDPEALAAALEQDLAVLRERLGRLLARPEIAEAIFLASPDLLESVRHWQRDPASKKGQRSELGLVRYLFRMTSRPTPFGLFAGCSCGSIGETRRLSLAPRASYRRHSRLDMDYLYALCDQLTRHPAVRAEILFRPNSSLHEAAGRLRYAESRLAGRLRTYHLVAVDAFDALSATLERAAGGARLPELAAALVADDPEGETTLEEAEEFVHELVDHQVLQPELALPVTGEESTPGLLRQLAAVPSAAPARERVATAETALAALDADGLGVPPEAYRCVARGLEPLGVPVELSRLFQVDLVKPRSELSVDSLVVDEILRGVDVLHRVGTPWASAPLDEFMGAFRERYGDGREVPLLAALDEESGIGFERSPQAGAEASPLVSGLVFRPRTERPTTPWGRREAFLFRMLAATLAAGSAELELGEADLERLETPERPPLPDAFHAMATLIAPSPRALEEGDFRLLVEHAFGPSGARLFGRFCHVDPELRAAVEAHLAAEEALAPDAVFAEIVHLPEGRIGNVLSRPVLRRYEIPFLGRSGVAPERQIPAADLLVTVAGDRVRLRSRRLDREVVPCLTNAHATSRESLGLYRFLGALQSQGRTGAVWGWGPLATAPYLPRVTHGRLVLARAQWRLLTEDLEPLAKSSGAERYRAAAAWRRERRMPRHVALVDGDNELLLDFHNPLSLEAVVELIKNRDEVVLTEVYPTPGELCAEGPEGRYFHELVVPFVRRAPAAAAAQKVPRLEPVAAVARTFPPGSEWLYAKIYTGTATADRVLRDEIGPLAAEAVSAGLATGWFFLRYGDPQWHLRVRFRGHPDRLWNDLRPRLEECFARLLATGAAWKVQLDTYEREIERYGGDAGVELAEDLFCHDSEAVVAILDSLWSDAGADLRWRLTLAGMDRLLDDFGYDLEAKLQLAERGRAGVAGRWRHEALRKPVADRLRPLRRELEALLEGADGVPEEARPGLAALERRSRACAPIVAELQARERQGRLRTPLAAIVPSYVHMFVNRLARSAGPEHEMVLYDFLVQLLRSRLARSAGAAREPRRRVAAEG